MGRLPNSVALSESDPLLATGPRYSVVVPAFNEEFYIGDCLRSLNRQDYRGEVEVIVVDNNSTDRTAQVARELGATVVFEPRPGVCFARQSGTEVARGKIIVSTDADTTFDAGWLSRIDDSFRRYPTAVAVAGPCRFVRAPRWGAIYPTLLFGLVHLVRRVTGRVFYISATNIAFRKSEFSGYDTRLTQGGDEVDLLRRLRSRGKVVFDRGNASLTSSRRLEQGLVYNFFVTFVYYYLMAYWLNRLFRRPVLGMAPAFRSDPGAVRGRARRIARTTAIVAVVAIIGWLSIDFDALL
ncbi:MAG: glycosyltransferase family 2 protein [Nakamurella sp.]